MAEIWLTEREVEKRRQKLDYLKGERRLEIAEMLKKNEYDIAVLEDELQHVHIIDESAMASGGVNIGTSVTVRNAKNGFETTYQIVGTTEADPRKGKISNESPIGAALLGHKTGEKVDVHTPGGLLELEIVCINA